MRMSARWCLFGMSAIAACASALVAPATSGAAEPAAKNSFGIKSEWVTSPQMLQAMTRLQEAGIVEGRRGSLTFFRWTNDATPKLAHLGLWGSQINSELLALIDRLPDLEFVSLYETDVDDDGVKAIARLPKLRRLSVAPICRYENAGFGAPQWSYPFVAERSDRPRITGRGLAAFAGCTTLEGAELLDARLTSADLELLKSWPKLSAVGLPNQIDAEAVRHLSACGRLSQLTLGYREVSVAEIEQLAAWPKLRRLTLIHAQLSDDALAAFAKLTSVEELRLEDCSLTAERVQHLKLAPKTKSLLLERNEISAAGLASLSALHPTTLGLEFNNIDDAGLDQLRQLTSVVDLRLAYCRGITDAGIRSGTLQQMTQVKRLELRGLKQITDASVDELAKFTHLAHIGLRETSVGPIGVVKLKAALPKTDVFK